MKVKIETTKETIVAHGGNLLVGELLEKTKLAEKLNDLTNKIVDSPKDITTGDIGLTYIGMLCQAQPEFEAAEQFRKDEFFAQTLGISKSTSCSTLRQRMNFLGAECKEETIEILSSETCGLIRKTGVTITPCYKNYNPLDFDVAPFDNSNTKKEGLGYTYKKNSGFAPIFSYYGLEGYCINSEFRTGSHHCQKGTPEFLRQSIKNAKSISDNPILVRMDSGNDAVENIAVMQSEGTRADFIIKRNPRKESLKLHYEIASARGRKMPDTRAGKETYVYETEVKPQNCPDTIREINIVSKRDSKADGQMLLEPEYELESYNVSLKEESAEKIQELYHAHGTMEQFHSEIKTDLDLERLPSGKFATNAVVLAFGVFAYNVLRIIGQESLKVNDYPPTQHKVKRRRIRTVIDRYITFAVKFVRHARAIFAKVSENNPWLASFSRIYTAFQHKELVTMRC